MRRLTRLQSYDYTMEGAYFFTICTSNRLCLFGRVAEGAMQPNNCGEAVLDTWLGLPHHYPHIYAHTFALMPNHVHGVLMIGESAETTLQSASRSRYRHGLPEIVRAFKTFSARSVNLIRRTSGQPVWQRSYYEHVIRNERSLHRISEYVENNPKRWILDQENPDVRRAGLKPAPTMDGRRPR